MPKLHLPDTDLKQTRFYQEVFAEGYEVGLAEVRAERREKGRQEGYAATLREIALNLIRLTDLADTEIAAVTGLEIAAVAALRQSERQTGGA